MILLPSSTRLGLVILVLSLSSAGTDAQCVQKKFDQDSFVCVCNSTYCDEIGETKWPADGEFTLYTSSRDEYRMDMSSGKLEDQGTFETTVKVSLDMEYQSMIGFGASFTDSAGIVLNSLSEKARENALRAFFSPSGSEYNVGRIPIGCSDFSPRPYSYDDIVGDVNLTHWALAKEDYDYKIPIIKDAMEMSPRELFLFGSPWSPPSWMKTTGTFNGSGTLIPEYRQPYSNYIVKFVEAYEAEDIPLWGLTPQNEPLNGYDYETAIPCCGWSAEDMRDWIKDYLGPTLEEAGHRNLKMMIVDFNRDVLTDYAKTILADEDASKYVDGVAVHWYSDVFTGPEPLQETHDLDPTKFMLYTEACEDVYAPMDKKVSMGNWSRAENYLFDIIQDLNYWSAGWVEWNMALDLEGGPAWVQWSRLDSSMLVDSDNDEFYKQPTYYSLAHASKFIERGAVRVGAVPNDENISSTAVVGLSGNIVVLVLNKNDDPKNLTVSFDEEQFINVQMSARSMHTFLARYSENK